MSYLMVTPKLVRVLDFNYCPVDLWVLSEFHQPFIPSPCNYSNVCYNPSTAHQFGVSPVQEIPAPYCYPALNPTSFTSDASEPEVNFVDYERSSTPLRSDLETQRLNENPEEETYWLETSGAGSLSISNPSSTIAAVIGSDSKEWGFFHPLGHIIQLKRQPLFFFLTLDSGITCYGKCTEKAIKFSSNRAGISYLIDEAGVRTCWDSFSNSDMTKTELWERCNTKQTTEDESPWELESENGSIRLHCKNQIFWSSDTNLSSVTMALSKSLYLTASAVDSRTRHIYCGVTAEHHYKQSIYFNGQSLRLKFHTQTACLDAHGLLSL